MPTWSASLLRRKKDRLFNHHHHHHPRTQSSCCLWASIRHPSIDLATPSNQSPAPLDPTKPRQTQATTIEIYALPSRSKASLLAVAHAPGMAFQAGETHELKADFSIDHINQAEVIVVVVREGLVRCLGSNRRRLAAHMGRGLVW